jgi:16S rRNA (guanine1207-N2)-methyltransferase
MLDPAFPLLLMPLQDVAGRTLWVADENALEAVVAIPPRAGLQLLTNRCDVADAARLHGHDVAFSDFDFSCFPAGAFNRLVFRISKEKPVVHHVLNHAPSLLAGEGALYLAGLKNEGTKTFIDKCRQHFGNGVAEKHGVAYRGVFVRHPGCAEMPWLDDKDYEQLRLVHTAALDFYSKPGIYGWDRVDRGSAFLLQQLPACLAQLPAAPQSFLDLGCGYGYLTMVTRHLPCVRRVATDNNAAALQAMERNAAHCGLAVEVLASDAGSSVTGPFDLVLCNPPFHQGFAVDGALTSKFLAQAHRLLAHQGAALFVVNAFLPLEQKARTRFSRIDMLANDRAFKVVMLRH